MASPYRMASKVMDVEHEALRDLLDTVFVHKDDRDDYENMLNQLVQTMEGDLEEAETPPEVLLDSAAERAAERVAWLFERADMCGLPAPGLDAILAAVRGTSR